MNKNMVFYAIMILLAAIFLPAQVKGELQLDYVQFDPAIVASGDRVDIVAQFHQVGLPTFDNKIGNTEYRFSVTLAPDDSLTKEYVLIEDAEGDDLQGIISRGEYYNKKFRIKVMDNAPPGEYEFKLVGQWFRNGKAEGGEYYLKFTMPVKKEGISLSIANIVSNPQKVRAGDKNILLTTSIANTGEKAAKNVRIRLDYPAGISSAYTNNNELFIGTIDSSGQKEIQFYMDTDRFIKEGAYNLNYYLTYEDSENNKYTDYGDFPFLVKKKPNIVVTSSEGSGLAGNEIELRVTVQNQGEETADAVDLRILKQSSQPFEMDVRSDYLGQLKPGQNATAVFTISAKSAAEIKEHSLNVVIRARGDSEEGDDSIYTFTESANIQITGKKGNIYPWVGLGVLAVVILVAISAKKRK